MSEKISLDSSDILSYFSGLSNIFIGEGMFVFMDINHFLSEKVVI